MTKDRVVRKLKGVHSYVVSFPVRSYIDIEVDAKSRDDAVEQAEDALTLMTHEQLHAALVQGYDECGELNRACHVFDQDTGEEWS